MYGLRKVKLKIKRPGRLEKNTNLVENLKEINYRFHTCMVFVWPLYHKGESNSSVGGYSYNVYAFTTKNLLDVSQNSNPVLNYRN
jgi:hypothetical protein